MITYFCFFVIGPRLVTSHNLHESSSVFVDSVTKSEAFTQQGALPRVSSDASKVVAKGLGLNKAFVGQKNSFTVDCSKAGKLVQQMFKSQVQLNGELENVLASLDLLNQVCRVVFYVRFCNFGKWGTAIYECHTCAF